MEKMLKKLLLFIVLSIGFSSAQIAIKAEKVYTMAGPVIENGIVLIKDSKIEKTGPADKINIPDGYKIIEGKVVTPGLIDAHSVVGLAGIFNQKHDQDQLETSDPVQPELRAIDAYNPKEELVKWLNDYGVTTINTGHAPGALSSGQTMIVKTTGEFEGAVIRKMSAVVFSLGSEVSEEFKSPGTRPKGMAMLRSALIGAQSYARKRETGEAPKDIKNDALLDVLNKKVPAIITANSLVDILGAIRLADEFNFNLILDGAAEAPVVLNEIKKAGVPVILHPQMARIKSASFETAKLFAENNITFAIQGGYESYVPKTRNVLFEAAIAVANGLPYEKGLESITSAPAKILKINDKVGSLESGKDADIVVFDGDPFEYTTHVCQVIVNGKLLKSECN